MADAPPPPIPEKGVPDDAPPAGADGPLPHVPEKGVPDVADVPQSPAPVPEAGVPEDAPPADAPPPSAHEAGVPAGEGKAAHPAAAEEKAVADKGGAAEEPPAHHAILPAPDDDADAPPVPQKGVKPPEMVAPTAVAAPAGPQATKGDAYRFQAKRMRPDAMEADYLLEAHKVNEGLGPCFAPYACVAPRDPHVLVRRRDPVGMKFLMVELISAKGARLVVRPQRTRPRRRAPPVLRRPLLAWR